MKQYLDLLKHIQDNGHDTGDRTGTGTRSWFGYQTRYNLTEGFPILTTKKVFIKPVIYELLWFLRGDTNIKFLVDHDVKIWNEWAYSVYLKKNSLEQEYPRYSDKWNEKFVWFIDQIKASDEFANQWGDLGPIYGKQWVDWEDKNGNHINQVQENVLDLIKKDPTSRRIIISGWNVGEIQELIRAHHSAPPPCHTLFQFKVYGNKLLCQL